MTRILGIVLFIGGIALIVGGYFASQSVAESVRSFLALNPVKKLCGTSLEGPPLL